MKVTVQVEGLSALEQALGQLPQATAKNILRRTSRAALEPMAEVARQLAPDDPVTGAPDLRTSIAVSHRHKSGRALRLALSAHSVTTFMGPTKGGYPQAIMQEFGTEHHPPQPFMRPAWDQEAEATLERVRVGLGDEIRKAADRLARKQARALTTRGG